MWLIFIAIAAFIVGNWLRKIGVEKARANPYGSAASLAGQRKSGLGTWLIIVGGICLVTAAVLWP